MRSSGQASGRLMATSDLHVAYPENRRLTAGIRPQSDADWLIVAGDVGEITEDFTWALKLLRERFDTVIWAPGNHELWTPASDPVQLRGEERYLHLVDICRRLGVLTPEDPYPVWEGPGGPVTIAPLFVLYDYSFRTPTATTKEQALAQAYEAGVVCTDEMLLHPDPYPSREAWCQARVTETERRLAERDPELSTVLVNHYPLVRDPTRVLFHPEFAQWCGTEQTAKWHLRYNATAVVYGHLHIPRTTWHDGVRFEEVSVGYPREHRQRGMPRGVLRQILPAVTPS
ncbi:metallophosphoesterase family protein [Streptomyces sp. WI04-05B]|uniref:metallophosphoesterase family protein n=1 Tax=Streptomyces TaxID=1883 RepID=UPI0029B9AD19|nr:MULTISPECIES: metallophosphoesterase [unclassified Streptomyces]MDX2548116.1 metallophosphoesterase [Streptomyces sp. WI04-05B]MDX2590296.1 metallophosphoesterase [Streptomyces sp. WI04-05A]MDX3745676.1 metallophosphoesterase [Streptomyces sp. AK08-02]